MTSKEDRDLLKSVSLRIRYFASLLLVLVPILALAVILVSTSRDRNIQYQNNSALQNFTYAVENISSLLDRLNDLSNTSFNIENEINTDAEGEVTVRSPGRLCAALGVLEERISPLNISALFYIQGDQNIYSSSGKMRYGEYEHTYLQSYDSSSSGLYTNLQKTRTASLLPLYSPQRDRLSGMAYAAPFPSSTASKGVLMFILSNDILMAEFENFLGEPTGGLYIYNDRYKLLFETELEGFSSSQAMKLRGVGVNQTTQNGQKLVVVRASDSAHGINCVWVVPHDVFYASMLASQRLMILIIAILLFLAVAMLIAIAFYNYKPIQNLLAHMVGGEHIERNVNELEVIRDVYDQTVDEAETLAARLNEMSPLITQQLVRQLILGRVDSMDSFQNLVGLADMDFSREWTVALYLSFSRQESDALLEKASMIISPYLLPGAFIAQGELPLENALCVLINYDSQEGKALETAESHARQLYGNLTAEKAAPQVIGVGRAYQSPLKMNESFAESSTAAQSAPRGMSVWHYGQSEKGSSMEETGRTGLSPLAVSLLNEGLQRGDSSVVIRVLNDMLDEIFRITYSLVYLRFRCTDLLSVMLRKAEELQLPVSRSRFEHLAAFTSPDEFRDAILALAEDLCAAMQQRISDNDRQQKSCLMTYILNHYKQPELSIQSVADETGIRKTQISTMIKEETGLGFVQYVSFLRMNEFKRLLVQSDATIRDLVLQIGYNDVPNFLRKFKSMEGMTPSQYRLMHSRKV